MSEELVKGTEFDAESSEGRSPERSGASNSGGFEGEGAGEDSPGPDRIPNLTGRCRGRRMVKAGGGRQYSPPVKPENRLLILDTWMRSGLSATDFAPLVGVSAHTIYGWKRKFDELGPEGLVDRRGRRGRRGSRVDEVTKRSILMLKAQSPELGCQAISDMLMRGPGHPAGPGAVAKVLKEGGYESEDVVTKPHKPKVTRFERSRPNQMWQTDIFTFTLKRQNRRVHLIGFMDDRSRFMVSQGLYASATAQLVIEVLGSGIGNFNAPEEVLTDNGPQYVTWRGKSAFVKELEKRGIKHILARPRHPQTLGKIERFWGTLWRGCVQTAVFRDLDEARERIRLFIDHYNFHRPHQGIDGATPADRFFEAAPEIQKTLKERAAANGDELAKNGLPTDPFYVAGRVAGKNFSLHAEGERIIMTGEKGDRREVELSSPEAGETPTVILPEAGNEEVAGPGESPLDEGLERLRASFGSSSESSDE